MATTATGSGCRSVCLRYSQTVYGGPCTTKVMMMTVNVGLILAKFTSQVLRKTNFEVYALHGDSIFFEGRIVSCIE